ncbi:hypothetical protein [Oceanobacillus kapialis]|uniref:Uncharacterized protein n=1 Tax=Oceanobacillus kapialis TaxID=481353 RepID=A0ABW5PYL7_9BACI
MEVLIMVFLTFLIMMVISSFLNIMFKTTEKKHWLASFSFSAVLSIILVIFFG